jgi:hypothetical protein
VALISKNPNVVTDDGIAAKVAYPTLALLAAGILLCVLDQTGVIDVGDELWLGIIGSALGALGIGAAAPPALTRPKTSGPDTSSPSRGL